MKKNVIMSVCSLPLRYLNRWFYSNNVPQEKIYDYWKSDEGNDPQGYLREQFLNLSEFLFQLIKRYVSPDVRVLEVGCNVGRNLHYLYERSYKNLEGIEIGEQAVKLMAETYPDMVPNIRIYNSPVEDIVKTLPEDHYGAVYTSAVLYHIHYNSDWVFKEMARITNRHIITIENEIACTDPILFQRNYKKVFERVGMKQVEKIDCGSVPSLKDNFQGFKARVFEKK